MAALLTLPKELRKPLLDLRRDVRGDNESEREEKIGLSLKKLSHILNGLGMHIQSPLLQRALCHQRQG